MARNKGPTGVVDTKGMPATPTGIVNPMHIASSLEAGADISGRFGADKPSPARGSKVPQRSAQRPVKERKQNG